MKEKIIRINAWFTLIFFGLIAIVSLWIISIEKFDIFQFTTFLLSLGIATTGFLARNFGLRNYKRYRLSKPIAALSLVGGLFFVLVVPLIFVNLIEVKNSIGVFFTLAIMFIPVILSSLSILFSKSKDIGSGMSEFPTYH